MRRKPATIKDVARHAGVSFKTVSRVINADPAVAPSTRERVRESIAALNYHRSSSARVLRTGVDNTVGLIIDSVADPFFAEIMRAVEEKAKEAGFVVFAASSLRSPERERELVRSFLERSCSGIICAPATEECSWLESTPIPVVFVDRVPESCPTDGVLIADWDATREAVNHLRRHHHRRIAFLSEPLTLQTLRDRHDGYVAALETAGLEPKDEMMRLDCPTVAAAFAATKEWMTSNKPPTAIICAGPNQAEGAIMALSEAQRQKTAIISFGQPTLAVCLNPGLTVIDHDPTEIGQVAMEVLLDRIKGGDEQPRIRRLRPRLAARGSGEVRNG